MWQTNYASAVPKTLGVGVSFRPCSEGYFLSGRPQSVVVAFSEKLNFNKILLNAPSEYYTFLRPYGVNLSFGNGTGFGFCALHQDQVVTDSPKMRFLLCSRLYLDIMRA